MGQGGRRSSLCLRRGRDLRHWPLPAAHTQSARSRVTAAHMDSNATPSLTCANPRACVTNKSIGKAKMTCASSHPQKVVVVVVIACWPPAEFLGAVVLCCAVLWWSRSAVPSCSPTPFLPTELAFLSPPSQGPGPVLDRAYPRAEPLPSECLNSHALASSPASPLLSSHSALV